jgi:lysophospholipase L1-like esterase
MARGNTLGQQEKEGIHVNGKNMQKMRRKVEKVVRTRKGCRGIG